MHDARHSSESLCVSSFRKSLVEPAWLLVAQPARSFMKTLLLVIATSLSCAVACQSAKDVESGAKPMDMSSALAGSAAPASQAGAPAQPMSPAKPMEPAKPMDPAMPVDPAQPSDPSQPFMPFGADAQLFAWSTGNFMLAPGQERYLCFASSLADDLVVNGYSSDQAPFVHHMIFSRTSAPEIDGFSECDVAFKTSWDPLFITGTGR